MTFNKIFIKLLITISVFSCKKIQEENSALVKNPTNAYSYESAKDWLDKEIQEHPDHDVLFFKRAKILFDKSLFSLSLQDINKAIELHPLPKYYLLKAKLLYETDDTSGIKQCLNYYERTKIDDFEFYNLKAHYLLRVGDVKNAFQANEIGIKEAPFCVDFYRNKGMIYYAMKDSLNAEKFLKFALENDTNNADNYYELAKFYENTHNTVASENLVKRANLKFSNHYGLEQVTADLLSKKRLYDSSIVFYNLSINHNPRVAETYLKRAIALMHVYRHATAESDLNKVLKMQPQNTLALKKLAICKIETGQYVVAEPIIEKLYKEDSTDSELRIYKKVIKNIHEKLARMATENANLQEEVRKDSIQ
ncbi:MAG: hypothetical protein U0V72_04395 [Cytophagales bacterium]